MGQYMLFFVICQKLKKIWHFEILLNTGPYAAGHFKVLFALHWRPSKLHESMGYHGKSKCLLEYCNEKLASST